MADSDIQITAGSGTKVDTRTVGTGADEHRQVVVIGDPTTAANVATVDATFGLEVDVSRLPELPAGSNTIGFVGITDGTNSLVVDTVHNDAESNTENHVDTASKLMGFNGTSWDRLRSSTTNGLEVDVTRIVNPLPAGTNMIGKIDLSDGVNDAVIDVSASDAESATTPALVTNARLKVYNGTTWDRQRGFATVNKTAQYTTAQTGITIWQPAAGRAVVITSVQIQSYGTTAGTAILWFGSSADTTYTIGTDFAVFDGEFAPSATNKPGVIMSFPTPIRGTTDFYLRLTTTNAQSIRVSVWGYEI
jgi:hypothetical protein